MKILMILLFFNSSFEFGQMAHLSGYYTYSNNGYSFKHCYEDETRNLIKKDDIDLVIDHLESIYDTDFIRVKSDLVNIWSSVIRKDGHLFELTIIGVTNDYVNYMIEIKYEKLII